MNKEGFWEVFDYLVYSTGIFALLNLSSIFSFEKWFVVLAVWYAIAFLFMSCKGRTDLFKLPNLIYNIAFIIWICLILWDEKYMPGFLVFSKSSSILTLVLYLTSGFLIFSHAIILVKNIKSWRIFR